MSTVRFNELAKLIKDSPNQSEYLEHFHESVKDFRVIKKSDLDKELMRIKTRQSQLGKELMMLNIERIAIMAVKDEQ